MGSWLLCWQSHSLWDSTSWQGPGTLTTSWEPGPGPQSAAQATPNEQQRLPVPHFPPHHVERDGYRGPADGPWGDEAAALLGSGCLCAYDSLATVQSAAAGICHQSLLSSPECCGNKGGLPPQSLAVTSGEHPHGPAAVAHTLGDAQVARRKVSTGLGLLCTNRAWCGSQAGVGAGGRPASQSTSLTLSSGSFVLLQTTMPGMKRDCGGAAAILGAFRAAIKQVSETMCPVRSLITPDTVAHTRDPSSLRG